MPARSSAIATYSLTYDGADAAKDFDLLVKSFPKFKGTDCGEWYSCLFTYLVTYSASKTYQDVFSFQVLNFILFLCSVPNLIIYLFKVTTILFMHLTDVPNMTVSNAKGL